MKLDGKELVIFDLDGTLAASKQPLDAAMAAILARLMSVAKVAVISGGGFPQFETQFLHSFSPDISGLSRLYILPTSGTRLLVWKGSWVDVYAEHLTPQEKERIMTSLNESLTRCGYTPPSRAYGPLIEDRGSQITFSALGQSAPLDLKIAWDPDRKKREQIVAELMKRIPEYDVRFGGTTSIDITRRGINKAYGIHKLEEYLKLPIEKMIFVGDALFYGGNDYPAKTTGIDCVQVSGPDETKEVIADWIKGKA